MGIKALKFVLSSDFAIFRDMSEDKGVIDTKLLPSPIQFAGILGAICGYKGLFDRRTSIKLLGKSPHVPQNYKELKGLEYSIVPSEPNFHKVSVNYNNSAGQNVNRNKETSANRIVKYTQLVNPSYLVYIFYSEELSSQYELIKKRLESDSSQFNFYLGVKDAIATFDYKGEIELEEQNGLDEESIQSWYYIDEFSQNEFNEHDEELEELYQIREVLFTEQDENIVKYGLKAVELSSLLLSSKNKVFYDEKDNLKLATMKI